MQKSDHNSKLWMKSLWNIDESLYDEFSMKNRVNNYLKII